MADVDPQAPVFGEQGEPCQECGAPLAADQRYCLNCGRRRAEPRVEFQRLIGAAKDGGGEGPAEAPQSTAAPPSSEPPKAERDYAPLAAVGGIAILGLMLLVGVLIGKGNGSPAAAPAPIVKVGGETANTSSSAEPEETKTAAAKPKDSKKSKGGGTGAKAVAGGLTGSAAHESKATVQASTDDLENLSNQSGESYEETIKKLPDKIATPGKPPPIDTSKAPGGGGAAETIE
jgi:hypothetical protein